MPISESPEEWSHLAEAAQKGDKKSYNTLLLAVVPYIRANVLSMISAQDAVDDLMQEVLISIHKSLHTYSSERPFKPWLYAIIKFRTMDYMRKHYATRDHKKAPVEALEFDTANVTNQPPSDELKDVEDALQAFPEQQQIIFKRIKIEGYTAKEVAKELGMKESAVKVSAHRTLNALKDKLQ